jgi:hypothetical protein
MDTKDLDQFLETEEGKTWLQSKTDSFVSKGINTYKSKFEKEELPKIIDTEVKKRNPEMTTEQKRIAELEAKFSDAEKSRKKAEVSSKLMRVAQERNIPSYLVDLSAGEDYETSLENLQNHYTKFNETLSSEVEKRIEGRKGPVRMQDDNIPLDLNHLPLNDPDFYDRNFDRLEEMIKKSMK